MRFRHLQPAILQTIVVVALLLFSSSVTDAKPICELLLQNSEVVTEPEAPPTRPETPIPQREPAPKRREIPIPAPDTPQPPMIPARPLEDPKDIQPEDLYKGDKKIAAFWNEMPVGLRRLMIETMKEERTKLEAHMKAKYGRSDPRTLFQAVLSLQTQIERIEANKKSEILGVIRTLMERHYGDSVSNLKIRIGLDLPELGRHHPNDNRTIPELSKSLDQGMIYRTELRNLWLQGEGWIGMKEFAFGFASELNSIHPGLAEMYQEVDRLYRFAALAQMDLIAAIVDYDIDHLPREIINAGRQIVWSDFEIVENSDGSKSLRLKDISAEAVGRNAWAAVHEARKAASHMVTPMEGGYRFLMPKNRRRLLDKATNSARAEIRQGVFGPAIVKALRRRIELARGEAIADEAYYGVVDSFFSLPPGAFIGVTKLLFDSNFEQDKSLQTQVREVLEENGVFE